ncbi:hypothetical protein Fcan01_24602 [Folsomia candida]|uniref:Uncharacterized protein n=1 Tax=Folsomia candida TaxID=158441 RepID=A0A226D8S7_FOLCA|nr:hypothetical protein Fcan01_24602 [Folsomia candida]
MIAFNRPKIDWIPLTNFPKKRVVFVNDNPLEKNCRTRLNYGDKIALLGKVRPRRGPGLATKPESLDGFFVIKEGYRAIGWQEGEDDSCTSEDEDPRMSDDENSNMSDDEENVAAFKALLS